MEGVEIQTKSSINKELFCILQIAININYVLVMILDGNKIKIKYFVKLREREGQRVDSGSHSKVIYRL